jgi:hypothetical protein
VLRDQKASSVKKFQDEHRFVAMAGDGINDARRSRRHAGWRGEAGPRDGLVLCGNCRRFQTLGRYVLVTVKRSLVLRCLIVLLSLALVSGNAHAALHLGAAHSEPCPEEDAHHTGKTSPHHQHRHDKDLACCCDCLGCSSAVYLTPELSVTPAELPTKIHYDALTASLPGRTLLPEPDPPRPGALIYLRGFRRGWRVRFPP